MEYEKPSYQPPNKTYSKSTNNVTVGDVCERLINARKNKYTELLKQALIDGIDEATILKTIRRVVIDALIAEQVEAINSYKIFPTQDKDEKIEYHTQLAAYFKTL